MVTIEGQQRHLGLSMEIRRIWAACYHAAEISLASIMHIPRFYIQSPIVPADDFSLPPEAAHHAQRVLRLRVGDEVQLFDPSGTQFFAKVREFQGKECRVSIEGSEQPRVESPLRIHLGQALLSSDKFDWVLQKSVELGVVGFTPLKLKRCLVQLDADRADKKRLHWQGVAISATEQSGRLVPPQVEPPKSLAAWIESLPSTAQRFVLDPRAEVRPLSSDPDEIALIIGPEGGFENEELSLLQTSQFQPVRLGPRILRSETAAVAALTAFQVWYGDFARTSL